MHGGQGWPAMPFSMRPWPRPLSLTQEASWARTTPPLFDFSVYRARGREGINRGQSSNTWKQQQLDYIEHNYSLVTMSCILHIIWI